MNLPGRPPSSARRVTRTPISFIIFIANGRFLFFPFLPTGCRYTKGTWTDCVNGEKTRVDTLKQTATVVPGECEPTRTTKKRCKQPSNCKYSKNEWSACDENGQKTKTLSLEQGDPSECEEKKTITKQCNQNKKNKSGRRANRKKTHKKDRNDKQELMATTEESKDVVKDAFEEPKGEE